MKKMQNKQVIKSAKGMKGMLIRSTRDEYFFRAYDSVGDFENFKDYDIYHSDMNIIIDDDDSYIYKMDDGEYYIDHSPQTLGYETNDHFKLEIIRTRITEYLENGGLFNPEAMEHDKVRELLIDIRNMATVQTN